MSLFPGTDANLLDGPIRVLLAPIDTTLPTRLDDVIDVLDPYDPVDPWFDLGLTADGSEYELDSDSESYEVEQRTVAVLEKITEVNRSLTVPLAEISPANLAILEEGTTAVIAGAAGKSAQTAVDVGNFESRTRYRCAFVAMRDKGFGSIVTESAGGIERGSLFGFLGYQAAVAAEASSLGIQKGELSSREVAFRFFSDPSISDPKKSVGRWLSEDAAQTIASA